MLVVPVSHVGMPLAANYIFFVASAISSGSSVTMPANILAGDLLVYIDMAAASDASVTNVVPSGFNQISALSVANQADNDYYGARLTCSYKIAAGTESNQSVTGMNDDIERKIALQYRWKRKAISSLSVSTPVTQATVSNPAQQTVAASAGTPPLLGITVFGAITGTPPAVSPRTTSITPDNEISSTTALYAHGYAQKTAPQNYTFDMDDEGTCSNFLCGFYFHNLA